MNRYLDVVFAEPEFPFWIVMTSSMGWAVAVGATVFLYLRITR